MQVREMISTHPEAKGDIDEALMRCIEQCYACAQTCTACADACLAEEMVADLRQCIRLNLDCADICAAAGAAATRRTATNQELLVQLLTTCALACRLCGDECEHHAAMMEHCRICAEACRRCADACNEAIASLRSVH